MQLNNGFSIEYVDDRWLHLHHTGGMTSVQMGRKRFPQFVDFLRSIPSQDEAEVSLKVGDLTFISTDLDRDEDALNIFIDAVDTGIRIIFPAKISQIPSLIDHLKNKDHA